MTEASTEIQHLKAFSDWLSISYASSSSPVHELITLLGSCLDVEEIYSRPVECRYRVGEGTLNISFDDRYHNLSFSGGALRSIRALTEYAEFLRVLGSHSYNITRLDIAYDVPVSGSDSLLRVKRLYPDGVVRIAGRNRRYHSIVQPSYIDPSRDTGTTYFQPKNYGGYISLRMYDKANELREKYSSALSDIPETTRYELTVKRGASLRDFDDPIVLFWQYLPSELLRAPQGLPAWKPKERIEYDAVNQFERTDYEAWKYVVQNHPVLLNLIEQTRCIQGGDKLLLREVQRMLGSSLVH